MDTAEQVSTWLAAFRLARGRIGTQPLHITLAGALRLIEEDLAASGARDATGTYYRAHARILARGLGGDAVRLHKIRAAHVRAYIDARRAAGIAPSTIVGKELFVLRRMLKLARAAGYVLPADPFDGVRLPKGRKGRFDVLTQAQVAAAVRTMRERGTAKAMWHADLVEFLFATGLRRAELGRLRVADIDMEGGRIFVDGKTANRYQPIGQAIAPVVRRLIAAAQPDGKLVTSYRTVEKLFEHWRARLDLPHFSPHVMRHSYATAMASRVGPYDLMVLMGHTSLTQTSRYFHGRGDVVRGALDSLQLHPPVQPPQ